LVSDFDGRRVRGHFGVFRRQNIIPNAILGKLREEMIPEIVIAGPSKLNHGQKTLGW
jgi:hypothetical protein